jgi:2,3-bisphosphoglycerate-independent phosphoglycerate mutase
VLARGGTAALLEAYPPRFHEALSSGKRIPSSYQDAALQAGLSLFTDADVMSGAALAVDWTGAAWRDHLGYTDSPLYTPFEAGRRMVEIAEQYTFSFFSHWLTDQIGHRGTVLEGVALIELFDQVMAGALEAWDDDHGLLIITSDHGNLEDLSHQKHTLNDVPLVVIGRGAAEFAGHVQTLADIAPQIEGYLFG